MDNFVVSARKYRPATFNTVVGQAHITNTLKNAIKNNHLAQAFLFCGPRGVGKTTCARILAKTINCTNRTAETEACDQCESCLSFNSGASLNVYELDAASNNSVDDIRNLVDQVRFAPQLGEFKIYIIDEVHMLSTSAFNAFLKTLEEPPKHAIFILATTEKHKIIPTILSRCQIFDFNRIQIDDIANHLAYIAGAEHISAEADALHIIAQKADGALRDACSIFDQIVSFAGNTVTYKAVIENLNILDYDYYFKVTDAVLAENISNSLLLFNEILNNGFDGHNFVAGMAGHLRNLLVSKDNDTLQLLEVGNNIKEKYKEQAGKCTAGFLVRGLTVLNKADIQYKASKNQRLQVELSLMQLCSINAPGIEAEKKNDISEPAVKNQQPVTTASSSNPVQTAQNTVVNPPQKQEQPVVQTPVNPVNTNTPANTTPIPPVTTTGTPVTVKKPIIKPSTPSINQLNNTAVKTTDNDNNPENLTMNAVAQKADPFTQQTLEKVWVNYANELKAKGRANLGAALSNKMPVLTDGNKIEFTTNNKALEEAINEDKMNFLGFLRKELNNYSIQLELKMVETEDKANLYTATDRYKRLAEKNPDINKFRQAFDLDIEF
ncbi:MAG: polymerase subunit gamma/tau [Bacteroidetes bacterium]|nr:polymerase subunit gamma/tau [Bacteroidota bacterium]